MSSQTAMSLMSVAEFSLWALLSFLFFTKGLDKRFPAMGTYLALRMASMPVMIFLFNGQARHWYHDLCYPAYFYFYWAVYIASAILLYFVCIEIFRAALSSFAGLMRFGVVAFRWAILASAIVSFSTISFSHRGVLLIPAVAYGLMRSVSVVELCLLGFLCLSMNALRLTARDLVFGIALGFGLMSANDFVHSLLISSYASLTAPLQLVYESAILFTLVIWNIYAILPEQARKPFMVPANSTILRWNEIATALGHAGTQVAVQPAGGFFLTDVEKVVDEALSRNLKSHI
jgi:hypothetical protein